MAHAQPKRRASRSMSEIAIRATQIRAQLGAREVLHNIDFSISRAKWTAVVGPNGAGKSTLLKVVAGLMPFHGQVLFPTLEEKKITPKNMAKHLSWLGQNEPSADDLSVYEVVMLGRIPHQGLLNVASERDHQGVTKALQNTQSWDLRERSLGQLSGGERQRVLLARALAVEADILLMDEPITSLDPPHQVDWLHLVRELVSQQKTVVSVLHELSIALHADELVVMQNGRIEHQGECSDPQTRATLEEVFDRRITIQRHGEMWVSLPKI